MEVRPLPLCIDVEKAQPIIFISQQKDDDISKITEEELPAIIDDKNP